MFHISLVKRAYYGIFSVLQVNLILVYFILHWVLLVGVKIILLGDLTKSLVSRPILGLKVVCNAESDLLAEKQWMPGMMEK